MTKLTRTMALVLCMMFVFAFASPVVAMANSLDDISNDSSSSSSDNNDSSSGAISDYLNDYTPITNDNMAKASTLASPLANFLGTVAGGIVIVVEAAIVVVTALDLAYIGLPFTRSILNPNYAGAAAQGGGMDMGMGGGFGGGYGRMGGMGMVGGMSGGQAAPQSGLRRQWVSDEAVQAVQSAQPQQQSGGMGGMGGMMGGFGGMGGMQQQQQPQPTRSVIATYFKSRVFFIILFTIAAIILTSSILTHSGINLAALLMKLINKGNNMVSNVQIQ